jgi:hypothetical protein
MIPTLREQPGIVMAKESSVPRRKDNGQKAVMGSRTFANMHKTVIIKRIDPETGEEVVVSVEQAKRPKRKPRLDKVVLT